MNRIAIGQTLVPIAAIEVCFAAFAAIYYGVLFTAFGHEALFKSFTYGLTFNDMLDHLLRGRFDVSPSVIGREGFVHNGLTYAYFGIFPALLHLPLMVLPSWQSIDVTLISCASATALAGYLKLRAVVVTTRGLKASGLRRS